MSSARRESHARPFLEISDSDGMAGTSAPPSFFTNRHSESIWPDLFDYASDVLDPLSLQDEVLAVQKQSGSWDLGFDIFGHKKLPLEISTLIAQHLEIYQIFQARRVSRSWNKKLSSKHCINTCLRPWFTGNRNGLPTPERLSFIGINSLKAEQLDAFCSGRAFSMTIGNWKAGGQNDHTRHKPWRMAYANGRLAWLTDATIVCFVVRLVSSTKTQLQVPRGKRTRSLAISTTMIAVATNNYTCYIWRLSEVEGGTFDTTFADRVELVCCRVSTIVISESKAAVLYDKTRKNAADMTIWDAPTRQTHHRSLCPRSEVSRLDNRGLLITQNGNYMVHAKVTRGNNTVVYFARLNTDGILDSERQITLPGIDDLKEEPPNRSSMTKRGCATLYSAVRCTRFDFQGRHRWEVVRICYNFDTDRAELKKQIAYGIKPWSLKPDCFFWRNDVAYFRPTSGHVSGLGVTDLRGGLCKEAEMSFPELFPDHTLEEGENPFVLGDERFLVSVWRYYYFVWCFNKNIAFSGDDEYGINERYKGKMRGQKSECKERRLVGLDAPTDGSS